MSNPSQQPDLPAATSPPAAPATENSIQTWLQKCTPALNAVSTRYVTADKLLRLVYSAAKRNPVILQSTRQSLLRSLMECSMLGLEPNTPLEQCALTAFRNNKTGEVECQLMVMFKGLMDLARRSGEVALFEPSVVYEGDEFYEERGTVPKLVHKPTATVKTDDKITHAYSAVKLTNGEWSFKVLTRAEIDKFRAKSKQKDGSFWRDHYPSMCIKTAIRQHCKTLPRSTELVRAMAIDDARDNGKTLDWGAIDIPESAVSEIKSAESEASE